ncbi:lysoplasmalogenase [Vitreimonas sp.]|uniref:lysoplasmalogenase n=1 Tax=Vitreimonas sp. TaxID=3069702 RepID=UPI002D7799B3|nr:lysoplasmalogenase [Vitreimonas sp.]
MKWFLLALSALLALAYGAFGASLYVGEPPYVLPALRKSSGIIVLVLIALWSADGGRLDRAAPAAHAARSAALQPANASAAHNKVLAAALLFGALGDALLAWSPDTFLYGAFAFLIGHLFYIALFLRSGLGLAALKQPPRALAALALIAAALIMTSLLVPRDSAMFIPLSVYTGVLTLMAIISFTLPAARWLAMAGAVLFFISDGFVAWNMFHPDPDPTLAHWRSFAGWMIYWAGQAALCFGALGLHKR